MRIYTTSTISLKIRYCAECPAHDPKYIRKPVSSRRGPSKWVSELSHVICKKTGNKIGLSAIDEHCPLPEYTERQDDAPTMRGGM